VKRKRRTATRFQKVVAVLLFLPSSQLCWPQQAPQSVSVQVHFDQSAGPISPVWSFFGDDELNYSYAQNCKKLLGELAAANATPVYVRTHNLLTSGDGSAALKWGSTNVYTEDSWQEMTLCAAEFARSLTSTRSRLERTERLKSWSGTTTMTMFPSLLHSLTRIGQLSKSVRA